MPKDSTKRLPKKLRPKKKCCSDKPKCGRCPLRMLKEGTLPAGYSVKKRKLVKTDAGKKRSKAGGRDRLPSAA